MKPDDFVENFNDTVKVADNLLANPTFALSFLMSEVRQSHKVMLSGGGADELFFGYDTYQANVIAKALDGLPTSIVESIQRIVSYLPSTRRKLPFEYKVKKFFAGLQLEPELRHHFWRTIFTEDEKALFLREYRKCKPSSWAYLDAFKIHKEHDFNERAARSDFDVWWKSMGNYQADVVSMAHSVEFRLPFMDNELRSLYTTSP